MRIAVVGAGGVGGGFGAALAKAGADVTFLARGAHLAAMKSQGLKVAGPRGDVHLVPTRATDDPAAIGKVDIVLFCVKLWDVESAGERIKPLIGPNTAVIPLQNGIDAAERLIPILGSKAVMGGVAQISASIIAPGVIQQVGTFMRMIFGELDGKVSKRGEDFLALCLKAGFDATLSEQILIEPLHERQLVYAKPFRIVQDVTLRRHAGQTAASTGGAAVAITGTLRYQACDDTICYLPTTIPVSWTVSVTPH